MGKKDGPALGAQRSTPSCLTGKPTSRPAVRVNTNVLVEPPSQGLFLSFSYLVNLFIIFFPIFPLWF